MTMKPFYETKLGAGYNCNSVDFLQALPGELYGTATAIITDPPYALSVYSSGREAKTNWVDMENAAFFYQAWARGCFALLKSDGFFMCFGNHNSLPVLYKVLPQLGFKLYAPVVWDKQIPGTGMVGFREMYELIIFGVKGNAKIEDRSAGNIFRCKWQSTHGKTGHPAEKPVALLEYLVEKSTKSGDLVVDPFLGSGTTAVACESLGRRWMGFELSEEYCEIAKRRLSCTLALPLEGGA